MTRNTPFVLSEAVLIFAVVFGPLAFAAMEAWSVAILEGVLFSLAALCVLQGKINREHPIYKTMLPAVLAIFVIGLFQFLNPDSLSGPASVFPFTMSRGATGRSTLLWSSYAALLLGAPVALSGRDSRKRVLWTIFLLGAAISVIGLMQRGQGNTAYYGLRRIGAGNPFGPYTNYDHAASMLVLSLFCGCGLWLERLIRLRRVVQTDKRIEGWSIQIILAFFVGVIFYSILSIRSRGAIHSMAFSTGIVAAAALIFFAGRRERVVGGILLFVSVASYAVYMIHHKAMLGLEDIAPMAPHRLALYRDSFQIVKDFPIFGTGLGSYLQVFAQYQDTQTFPGIVDHAHNDWLEILIQTGVIGASVYVIAVVRTLIVAVRGWAGTVLAESRYLGGACLAAVLAFIIHGFVDFSFQSPANAVLFLVLLVCLSSVSSSAGPVTSNEI